MEDELGGLLSILKKLWTKKLEDEEVKICENRRFAA